MYTNVYIAPVVLKKRLPRCIKNRAAILHLGRVLHGPLRDRRPGSPDSPAWAGQLGGKPRENRGVGVVCGDRVLRIVGGGPLLGVH